MTPRPRRISSLGSYEITRKLGSGGMADVYLAVQRMAGGVERPVVLKSILPHLAENARFVRMFVREARIAAQLSHPNIVQIIDVQELDGLPCIVMEALRGRDLAVVLGRLFKRGERPSPEEAIAVTLQAAAGLDHAHRAVDGSGRPLNLVHRDVSPQNLFLTRDGHVRVLDFGIARVDDGHHTQHGTLKGKPAYMAPEQARGHPLDARADQFALGVVLWEALTGARLFRSRDPLSTLRAICEAPIDPPSKRAPAVAPEIDAITMRLLQRDPSARFPSCRELADALEPWMRSSRESGASIVARLVERAVPAQEDDERYGVERARGDARSEVRIRRTGLGSRGASYEDESEDEDEADEDGVVDVASPDASEASTQPRVVMPARRRGPPAWAVAVLVGVVAGAAIGLTLGFRDTAPSRSTSAQAPPRAPTTSLVLAGVTPDARVEIDGRPADAGDLRVTRDRRHVVRVLRGEEEIWRWEGAPTEPSLRLRVPAAEAPAPLPAIEPEAPEAAPVTHSERRGTDRAEPDRERAAPALPPVPVPVEAPAAPRRAQHAADEEAPSRPEDRRSWARDRTLQIETDYP